MDVLRTAMALSGAVLSWLYWRRLIKTEPRFREWVAASFDVTISTTLRGHWKVRGSGSWWKDVGLELLQLVFFLGGFALWALGLLLLLGLLALLG